jgi:hypothetical protein
VSTNFVFDTSRQFVLEALVAAQVYVQVPPDAGAALMVVVVGAPKVMVRLST